MASNEQTIRIKLVHRGSNGRNGVWTAQCPGGQAKWGNCQFLFDPLERDYDWLVVTDDIPRALPSRTERLACPRQNTILITTEPSSVTRYGKAFAAQFGTVLTNQEDDALPHPNTIRSQTGNIWFYGKSYAQLIGEASSQKNELISTVCSSKQQAHTLHARRYIFTQKLKAELPELEIFGHGVRYIEKKHEALDPYKFHLAIENHIAPHVWTEKLADAFLGWTVPIYCGCPNIFDYFPEDSLIPIDIEDVDESLETIRKVLTTPGEYERRLDAVTEARRRVIEQYNLPAMLSRIIENAPAAEAPTAGEKIYCRQIMRARHPMEFVRFALWRIRNAMKS